MLPEKVYLTARAVAWLMSSVHYRKELNFSDETIATARKELEKVLMPIRQTDIKAALAGAELGEAYDEAAYREFLDQLDDDMNTPNAYTVIFETIKKLNGALRQREINWETAGRLRNAAEKMLGVLGIVPETVTVTEEDRELFAGWNAAKAEKDFAKADAYRAKLMEKGLI